MITITPYTLDAQEVEGVEIKVIAQNMQDAARELNQPIVIASRYWILCGQGDQRYLITEKKEPACDGPLNNQRVGFKTEKIKLVKGVNQIALDLIYH